MIVKLKGLQFTDYAHEKDIAEMKKLEKSRVVRTLMGSMSDFDYELRVKTPMLGNGIRLDKSLSAELFSLVEELCEILDYDHVPEIYLKRIFSLDSQIIGYHTPVIIMPMQLLGINKDWLMFELGGAISKFKSGYLSYFHAATLINIGCEKLLPTFLSDMAMADFRSWSRKAELTADRAGLLCCQNYEEAMKFMMLKSGMTKDALEDVDIMDYIETANAEIQHASTFTKFGRFNRNFKSNVGLKNDRIIELFHWYQSGNYDDIIEKYGE